MKNCPRCHTCKPLTEFYVSNGRPGPYCKPCTKADVAAWAKNNPDRFRRTQRRSVLKRRYGLAESDVERMLADQGGRCRICRAAIEAGTLAVDHDHATGRLRALLCSRCNRVLGLLREDSAVIRAAVIYLAQRRGAPGTA